MQILDKYSFILNLVLTHVKIDSQDSHYKGKNSNNKRLKFEM